MGNYYYKGDQYRDLKEPCYSAILTGRCLGCNKLEDPNFTGDKNCKYGGKNE